MCVTTSRVDRRPRRRRREEHPAAAHLAAEASAAAVGRGVDRDLQRHGLRLLLLRAEEAAAAHAATAKRRQGTVGDSAGFVVVAYRPAAGSGRWRGVFSRGRGRSAEGKA